jgi:hypothetical protein
VSSVSCGDSCWCELLEHNGLGNSYRVTAYDSEKRGIERGIVTLVGEWKLFDSVF